MSEHEDPRKLLNRVPNFLQAGRLEEAERLLIAVLRGAEDSSRLHLEALLTLAELYESQGRFAEGLIVGRGISQDLDPSTELGQRGRKLMTRLVEAEGKAGTK